MVDPTSPMNNSVFRLPAIENCRLRFNQSLRDEIICWLKEQADWTHAVTLTIHRSEGGYGISNQEVDRRCRLFLNRINRRIYKHATKRKGFRIASVAFLGNGAYGDNPHVHWAFQKPSEMTPAVFDRLLREMCRTTKGIGQQFDVKDYRDEGWLGYMVDHGFEGLMEKLTFTAVCHKH
jgi:hypothetical protein